MSLRVFQQLILQSLAHRPRVSSSRLYSRWTHRKPAKVVLPFEAASTSLKKDKVIDLDPEKLFKAVEPLTESTKKTVTSRAEPQNENKHSTDHFKEVKALRERKVEKTKVSVGEREVFDENGQVVYEKCKENDGRISSLLVKLKSKKERLRSGMVLVEGWRLIVDGLEAKCPLKYIIFSRTTDLNRLHAFLPKKGVRIYKVPYKEIEMWSDVDTCPGIFGVFETPTVENIKRSSRPFPVQVVCDNIRVPGNLGAILRAAAGMGCNNVVLTKGCVDLWDPKVIRSAAGAHFRLPVHNGVEWDDITTYVSKASTVFIADSNTRINDNDDTESTNEEEEIESNLPVLPYYSVEYPTFKFITLIVGGETEGISVDSYRFASTRNGMCINIPLQRGVDSLNTGMATAVIAFEIKKQLLQAYSKEKMADKLLHAV